MEESFENDSLEHFVIKDKKFRKERISQRIRVFMIILFVLIIFTILAIIVWKVITNNYGKIICIYQTFEENETIELINIYEDNENMKFYLIINDENFDQSNNFTFKKPGNHSVSFVFKKKLKSL